MPILIFVAWLLLVWLLGWLALPLARRIWGAEPQGSSLIGGLPDAGLAAGRVLLLALWTLAYGGLFYFVGLKAKKQEAMMGLIPLFLPLSMLSTAYLPRDLLPRWIQWAARLNPYSYVVDGTREFSTGHANWSTFAAAVAAATITAALLHRASTRAFSRLVNQD